MTAQAIKEKNDPIQTIYQMIIIKRIFAWQI